MPRFRRAARSLDELAARERMTRPDIDAWQLVRLNRVWAHAVEHVPYYRALARDRRLPARFRSLAEYREAVPVLRKPSVAADPNAFR